MLDDIVVVFGRRFTKVGYLRQSTGSIPVLTTNEIEILNDLASFEIMM